MGNALEIVNRFYAAVASRSREEMQALVTEDVTFVGPAMKCAGSREFVAGYAWYLGQQITTQMLYQFADGDEVYSIYDMSLITPAGVSLTLPVAEWVQVKNGKIAAERIMYDNQVFARAFGR